MSPARKWPAWQDGLREDWRPGLCLMCGGPVDVSGCRKNAVLCESAECWRLYVVETSTAARRRAGAQPAAWAEERDTWRERRARALRMAGAGAGGAEIASALGISASTVYQWLSRQRRRGAHEQRGGAS